MKAFVHEKGKFTVKEIDEPVANEGEVIVDVRVTGLNHRDLFTHDKRGSDAEAFVIGSDGAGVVESVGKGVTDFKAGDEVIINPSVGWFENTDVQPADFSLIDGTMTEKIAVNANQLEPKPNYLTWEEAGVLTLPAMTGYRAMFTKGELKEGETVFIPGAGSGVATYLVSFAKSVGARVIVTSRSEAKREAAKKLGADVALDDSVDWNEALENETIDLVIDSVGAATFNRSLGVLKPGGRMVVFGSSTEDVVELNIRDFFYGQYQLIGSTMASREELREMLSFMEQNEIRPVIDSTYTLDEAKEALDYLKNGEQYGKIAVKINA